LGEYFADMFGVSVRDETSGDAGNAKRQMLESLWTIFRVSVAKVTEGDDDDEEKKTTPQIQT